MRRGQITLYVILGIIILAVIILGISLRERISESLTKEEQVVSTALQQETSDVKQFVDNCIQDTAYKAIYVILNQGGLLKLTEDNSVEIYTLKSPLYTDAPTIDDVKNAIEGYMDIALNNCIRDFESFGDLTIKEGEKPKSTVTFGSKATSVRLEYPIMIKKGEESSRLEDFSKELNVDVSAVHDEMMKLYDKVKEELSELEVAGLAKDAPYDLAIDSAGEATVYVLSFREITIEEIPIVTTFAIKYEGEEFNIDELGDELLEQLFSAPELLLPISETAEEPTLDEIAEGFDRLEEYEEELLE